MSIDFDGICFTPDYVRENFREVHSEGEIFRSENVYLANEDHDIVGLNLANLHLSNLTFLDSYPRIESLDLNNNELSSLDDLAACSLLKKLDISSNRLQTIDVLLRLPVLNFVDLRNNNISALPEEAWTKFPSVEWEFTFRRSGAFLAGNPLVSPPIEIAKQGKDAVSRYFESVRHPVARLGELKVILLGNGGAGKTSLIKALKGEIYNANEEITREIAVRNNVLEVADTKLNVWDFGGQEIMHSLHLFFLTEQALYVVVLDGRSESRADFWLQLIYQRAPRASVLIVVNKIDANIHADFSRSQIRPHLRPLVKDVFRVSCNTGEGIAHFREAMLERCLSERLPNTQIAVTWLQAKHALECDQQTFLATTEFYALCRGKGIHDRSEQDLLLYYLNEIGVVIHFPTEMHVRSKIVLHPARLIGLAYRLLTHETFRQSGGRCSPELIDRILSEDDQVDAEQVDYVSQLMDKKRIYFALPDNSLVFPSALPLEPPLGQVTEGRRGIVLEHDFTLPLFMSHFMGAVREFIDGDCLWKWGFRLWTRTGSSVIVNYEESKGRISLTFEDGDPHELMLVVRNAVRRIAETNLLGMFQMRELIPIPNDENSLIELDELMGIQELGRDEYVDGKNRRVLKIGDLMRSAGALAASAGLRIRKDDVRSRVPRGFVSYSHDDVGFANKLIIEANRSGRLDLWIDSNIPQSEQWRKVLEEEIRKSDFVVSLTSESSVQSTECLHELDFARGIKKRIIFVMLEDVEAYGVSGRQHLRWSSAKAVTQALVTAMLTA